MPAMNGQDFAQLVTQTQAIKSPQIIMLSSCDQPVSKSSLGRIGIDSYLIKPVRERRLFDTIVRVLSNPAVRLEQNDVVAPVSTPIVSPPISHDTGPVPSEPKTLEILVAEDFALNQDVVKLMLADTPFVPVFANTGQEALDIYMQNPARFPLILMDVSMPVMDGHQATRAIRAFEAENQIRSVPVIALTGHALKNDREDCLKAGMDDYLTKPVKQLQLIEKLETYTGKAIMIKRTA